MASAAAGTVAVAGFLAMLLASRVLRPVRQLARRARAVAEKRTDYAEVQPSFVREFEVLRNSLAQADDEMRRSLDESQQAERVALESNAALRLAERIARMGSWTLDPETGQFIGSDMLHELMGLDQGRRTLTLEDLEERMADDSFVLLSHAVAHCRQTGIPFGIEIEFFRHDGTSFHSFIQGQVVQDGHGQVSRISGTVQDITERKEHSERMAALADNLPSGVIYRMEQEPEGGIRISYISAGLERLTGIPATRAVAESSALIGAILPSDRLAMMEKLDHSARSDEIYDQEFRLKTAEGRQIWMHARAAARRLPNGRMVWDGILRDISAEREVGDALRRAKDSAEKAEKAKSDFLAAMSHEIRTPMNSVVGMTRLALQTNLDSRQRNYLEKIDISAQSLLGIINDILDFSKIEAGGMELERTTFELEQVLKSVSTVIALRAEEKDLEVAYAIATDTPPLLVGDPLRLGQVLTNLLGNAVKFTPKGEIVVSIRPAAPSAKGRPMLQFSVRDSGIGMNAEQLRNLFKPFTQASIDTSRKYGGTGLGLAICKRLVELMGGRIWADSAEGAGTTFHFTAELEVAEDDGSLTALRRPSSYLRNRRVLIVDDNASARQVLSDMTRDFGMETQTATGGEEALEILRHEAAAGRRFDLVLVDWRMPGMDGMETARHIKQDEAQLKLPSVLMVTAFNYDAVLEAAGEIGIKGVLIKPVTQSVLFNTVLGILSVEGAPVARARAAEVGGAHRIEDFRVLAGRRALVVDDNAFNREVASDFLHLVGIEAETAINGREAITLMEDRPYDVVLMDMHMPVMDGLSAVREIRQNPAWRDLPVVALTAQARVEDHLASHEAGMTAHLSKPIDEFALYGTLVKVLGLDLLAAPAEPPPTGAALPEAERFVPDLARLTQRFGGNQDRVLRMLRGFQRDFSGLTERLEMQLVAGDLPALADIAHQVKGAAGYFGAEACVTAAAEQERLARAGEDAALAPAVARFIARLDEVLAAIAGLIAVQDQTEAPATPTNAAGAVDLLELIDRAVPLVRAGDFAARSLLEDLATGLRGGELAAVIEVVLDLFDDLELGEAAAALTDLRTDLAATMAMGAV